MTEKKQPFQITLVKNREDDGILLTTIILLVPLRALFLMLGLGVIHNDWTEAVPALGYWPCVLVVMMLGAVLRK
jgi:hypothetical protein